MRETRNQKKMRAFGPKGIASLNGWNRIRPHADAVGWRFGWLCAGVLNATQRYGTEAPSITNDTTSTTREHEQLLVQFSVSSVFCRTIRSASCRVFSVLPSRYKENLVRTLILPYHVFSQLKTRFFFWFYTNMKKVLDQNCSQLEMNQSEKIFKTSKIPDFSMTYQGLFT